jgi:hypothetical protein
MKRLEIIGEHKKGVKAVKYNAKPQAHIEPPKPRNPVAKNANAGIGGGAAGAHKDKKKAAKQGDVKHKNKEMAEGLPQTLRKVVPGYAKREIDKKMDAGKFGKTDADKDANFQRYKKIQDKLKEQGVAEIRDRRDAYQRDYDSSVSGFGRPHDHRGLEQELGHETNNYAVSINGRTWKVFGSKSHAEAVARKIQMRDPNKKVGVHETGADVSEEAAVGKIEKVGPEGATIASTNPADKTKTIVPQNMIAKDDKGNLVVNKTAAGTAAGEENPVRPGAEVAITAGEDMMSAPNDTMSPINGDNDHDEISKLLIKKLKALAGL